MNIQIEKLHLIEWILALKDPSAVQKVKQLQGEIADWSDGLAPDTLKSIERGLKDVKAGRLKPHSTVKKRYEKWLKN